MLKEEFPTEVQTSKDPLKDSLMDDSTENVAVSQPKNDISNILKIEMDEPLIDQDAAGLCNKTLIDDSDDIKYETDDNEWLDTSDSDESSNTEMSFIQFESARNKEKARQDLREARENMLEEAKLRAEQRAERDANKILRGETNWMLPSVKEKLLKKSKEHTKNKKKKN
ncbi:CWF19-like protein 2 homolog [Eumeta japonica]|uniref:CWF19-like protein 2 homolog n=1 Tax=Eumeta variegata TaxID=151549 RepID=A0A4C1TP62_EUMVA|nr:CWF19-like protein 2 homolog [Eumeta japonica]